MSKKRLEEIEKNLDPLGYGMGGHLISVNDIYWLVRYAKEQSERVQELEAAVDFYQSALRDADRRVQELESHIDHLYDNNVHLKGDYRLQEQNKRYREAIRECIERMNEGGAGTRSFVYEKLIEVLEGNNDA